MSASPKTEPAAAAEGTPRAEPREPQPFAITVRYEGGRPPVPRESTLPPDQLDHFEVLRPLGQGTTGIVYLARDTSLDRLVALKVLSLELAKSAEAQERFIREARAQAKLASPRVAAIYFIGMLGKQSDHDQLYFAMEHVDGESLEAALNRGERLDPERARQLMIQAAEGLRDAHQAGIVHRDVKPGNLLVHKKGTLKITDFGLAKPQDPSLQLTKNNAIMGTPLYMAPEQATGEAVDHRSDMYSLGCTFYHVLAGEPLFTAPSTVKLLLMHVNDPAPPLRSRAPKVSPKLAAIVDRLLRKSPAERFATYEDLLRALEGAAPERIVHAGFWTRGGAALFDAALASLLIAVIGWPGLIVYLAYVTLAHAFIGQTLGKFLLRIQVRRLDGSRLGLLRSLARTAAALWLPFVMGLYVLWSQGTTSLRDNIIKLAQLDSARALIPVIVTNATLLTLVYVAGYLIAAVHGRKRAVHDFLVGSEVVFRMPGAPLLLRAPSRPR